MEVRSTREDLSMGVPTAIGRAEPSPRRCRPAGNVVVVLGVLAVAAAVSWYVVPRGPRGPVKAEVPVAAPVSPVAVPTVSHTVVYELLGEGGARNVTYAAEGATLAQRSEVSTPWSTTFTRTGQAGRTEFYSVAAENRGPGPLRCRIVVDGVVVADKTVTDVGRPFSCAV